MVSLSLQEGWCRRMESGKGRLGSDLGFDYTWVDGVVTEVTSYYQSAEQLREIPWGILGNWDLEGPKGLKRACSHFRGCGFVT